VDVLLITGPAGVGKSTAAYELSRLLERRDIAHALIDSDELDRIYPPPSNLAWVTEESLSAVWGVLTRHGAPRLVLVGVYLDLPHEREWISRAVPEANMTCIRLLGSEPTLRQRIRQREIGSGMEDQIERTVHQLNVFASAAPDASVVTLPTDGRTSLELAAEICQLWPSN
jgi:DNA polymerase III delta prime subunit